MSSGGSMLSNLSFRIRDRIRTSDGPGSTFRVTGDLEQNSTFTVTGASVVLLSKSQIERYELNITAGVATIVKRGLDQSESKVQDTDLRKERAPGSYGYITNLSSDLLDIDNDGYGANITTNLNFYGVGTCYNKFSLPRYTTAERNALTDVRNGTYIYNTTTGTIDQYIGGAWTDTASGTTINATTSNSGKGEVATPAETIAGDNTGSEASLWALPGDIAANAQSGCFLYGVDAGATDAYAITLIPALTAYTAGMTIIFKANTINTGACSLNINALGAKSIKRLDGSDPEDGDIAADDIVEVIYNGTNFVLQKSCPASETYAGLVERLTDAEAVTGTDTTKYPSISQITTKLNTKIFSKRYIPFGAMNPLALTVAYQGIQLPAAGTSSCHLGTHVDGSWGTIASIVVHTIASGTNNGNVVMTFTIARERIATTEQSDTDADRTYAYDGTANQMLDITINGAAYDGITMTDGDLLNLTITRSGDDGNDSYTGIVIVAGVTITYTAA